MKHDWFDTNSLLECMVVLMTHMYHGRKGDEATSHLKFANWGMKEVIRKMNINGVPLAAKPSPTGIELGIV